MEDICVAYMWTQVDPELLIKPKLKMRSYSVGKWSRLSFPQIACQKVLKQYCHKSVLRIKQKLKKMDLTSLVSTEKKMTKVLYFRKEKAST